MFKLISLSFILIFTIIVFIITSLFIIRKIQRIQIALFLFRVNVISKHTYRYKKNDDFRIIYNASIVLFILSLTIWIFPLFKNIEYDYNIITLQVQAITICLATVAAIIAFKNYQRKSGDNLYFNIIHNNNGIPYLQNIILYNAKDKATVIFAIDLVQLDKNYNLHKIRFFQDITNPIIIPAYSSKVIKVELTYKYTDGYIR